MRKYTNPIGIYIFGIFDLLSLSLYSTFSLYPFLFHYFLASNVRLIIYIYVIYPLKEMKKSKCANCNEAWINDYRYCIYIHCIHIHLTCIISYAKIKDASTKVVNEEGSSNEMTFLGRIGLVEELIKIKKNKRKWRKLEPLPSNDVSAAPYNNLKYKRA